MGEERRKILTDLITLKTNTSIHFSDEFKEPSKVSGSKDILGHERNIRNHLNKNSLRALEYYEHVFGWIQGNPSKKDLFNAIESVYAFCEELAPGDSTNLINTNDGHSEFVDLIKECNPTTCFIIAPRGAGKTFYLNYLINTKSEYLLDNHVIWFRVDITKIYKRNVEMSGKRFHASSNIALGRISLLDYLYLQVIYVSFKYRRQNPILGLFWDDNKKEANKYLIRSFKTYSGYDKSFNDSVIIHNYKSFIKKLKEKEQSLEKLSDKGEPDFYNLHKADVEDILNLKGNLITGNIYFYALLNYLHSSDYKTCFIIDGLDNMDFHRYTEYYDKLISDISELCLTQDKLNILSSMFIISLRDETYAHLKSYNPLFFGKTPKEFRIKDMLPSDIIKTKLSTALNPEAKYHSSIKKSTKNIIDELIKKSPHRQFRYKSIRDFDKLFVRYSDSCIEKMINALKSHKIKDSGIFNSAIQNELDYFNIFYNKNMRDFIYNFLNIFAYYMLFYDKKPHIKEDRNYVLSEGQVLNGHLYINTKESEDTNEFGYCVPNIFWFESFLANQKWHGLSQYRILQTINTYPNKDEKWIIEFIISNFKYASEIIRRRFFSLITNGLISCYYEDNSQGKKFELTPKGKLYLGFPFWDIDRFYYFALDTPMSSNAIGNSKMIKLHRNDGRGYWLDYNISCILTSITLIRHIITQHNNERLLNIDGFDRIFSFPKEFPMILIKGLMKKMEYLNNIAPSEYTETLNDIKGLI